MIEIYHGDGKGKTTAAIGAAVRAAGHSVPVVFCQFLKDGLSGEISTLEKIPGVFVLLPEHCYGFTFRMTEEEKRATRADSDTLFRRAVHTMEILQKTEPRRAEAARARKEKIGVVKQEPEKPEIAGLFIFDEILDVVNKGLLDRDMLIHFLFRLPQNMEVILTGRNPDITLLSMADYVTNMEKEKHPYDDGITARVGVEK